MTKVRIIMLGVAALAQVTMGRALANVYPVSGLWTYENSGAPGPAEVCAGRTMEFRGAQRLDTGGSVPEYRNVSVSQASWTFYNVVDEFYTLQIRGRVDYTLQIRDADHIVIHLNRADKTFLLRRCV